MLLLNFLPVLSLETSVCMLSIIDCLFSFRLSFYQKIEFSKFFSDIRISLEIQKFENFSGSCSPEFDNFITYLATL